MSEGGVLIPHHLRVLPAAFATALLAVTVCLFWPAGPAVADLKETASWGGPVAADEPEPGRFGAIGDLAIGPGGIVGAFDPDLGRVQLFEPDGGFKQVIDFDGDQDPVSLDLRDDGSVEVFDRANEKLYRFDADGEAIETIEFTPSPFEGQVRDFSQDRSGGYIAAFGDDLRVARFDAGGTGIVNWPTGRVVGGMPWGGAVVEIDEHDVDDRVYLASGGLLGMFSRSGEPWANWSLVTEVCEMTGPGLIDLALDGKGNIYLLASLSAAENRVMLFKLDETMNEVWREAVDPGFSKLGVGPDDAIYLAGGVEIKRFARTEPAVPVDRKCEKPPPPETKKFELLGLKYGPDRAWARVRMHLPEGGRITLSGPKVRRKSRTVTSAGNHAVTVKAKPKFLKPARPRKRLKFAVQVTYTGSEGTTRKHVKVLLRGKLRKKKPPPRR